MRLKYQILWVENDFDWIESIEDDIKELIEDEYGFIFDKRLCAQKDEQIIYNQYDLILMDLNLASEPSGDILIQSIREREIYTDVIFYSADGVAKIKDKAYKLGLEGVYFSGRDKILFLKKIKSVIRTTIHKVQDLNNLRGLVMAEVSELDVMMEQIIMCYFTDEIRMQSFHQHITGDRERALHKILKPKTPCDKNCYHVWRDQDISDFIGRMESAQRARAVNLILKQIDSSNTIFNQPKFYQIYEANIINNRNNLAHCTSEVDEYGTEILKTKKGDQVYTAIDFKNIRSEIVRCQNLFTDVLKFLNQ